MQKSRSIFENTSSFSMKRYFLNEINYAQKEKNEWIKREWWKKGEKPIPKIKCYVYECWMLIHCLFCLSIDYRTEMFIIFSLSLVVVVLLSSSFEPIDSPMCIQRIWCSFCNAIRKTENGGKFEKKNNICLLILWNVHYSLFFRDCYRFLFFGFGIECK